MVIYVSVKDVVAKRLYKSRIDMGYTLRDVGSKLNFDYRTISDYEKGRYAVSLDNLLKFAELYGVSVNYLLGISSVKTDDTTICNYTGLSNDYIDKIHKLKLKNQINVLKQCIDDLSKDEKTVDTEDEDVESIIGKNIRRLRKERCMTILGLCRALGISNTTLYAIERGKRRAKVDIMLKFSKYFNKDIEWFSEIH